MSEVYESSPLNLVDFPCIHQFLEYTQRKGNDLTTPRGAAFPGLRPGDRWALCASRWVEALRAGVAPPLILEATHEKMLDYVSIDVLKAYAVQSNERQAKEL